MILLCANKLRKCRTEVCRLPNVSVGLDAGRLCLFSRKMSSSSQAVHRIYLSEKKIRQHVHYQRMSDFGCQNRWGWGGGGYLGYLKNSKYYYIGRRAIEVILLISLMPNRRYYVTSSIVQFNIEMRTQGKKRVLPWVSQGTGYTR